jgi:hypothetical protein
MASLPAVVNSVCLRRAPCPFLGSPTHYHRISRTWEIAHEIDQPTAFADEKIAALSCGGWAHGDLRRQHADPKQ